MPYGGSGLDISVPAAADLSSHQFKLMVIDANGRGTIGTGYTSVVIGVLQNKPDAADAPARIRVGGESKYKAGAAANEGAYIASNAEGFGTPTTLDTACYVGIVLHAPGGSADVQDILVMPGRYAG